MIWFTSDWHIGHRSILEFCKRPYFTVTDMNKGLVSNFNAKVHQMHTTYFLGDMALGTREECGRYLADLKGTKILVRGNHDSYSDNQYKSMGFQAVYEELVLRLFGRLIRLSHYPRRPLPEEQITDDYQLRYLDRRPPDDTGRWLLHGHTHSPEKINVAKKQIHVGVDAWDMKPVSLPEVESMIALAEKF